MNRLFIVILLFSSFAAQAQQEGSIWYFGQQLGLQFKNGTVTLLTDGQTPTAQIRSNVEGTASICDKAGRLLFYSDGMTVWDKTHQPMQNGTGLNGEMSASQAAIIAPFPNNRNKYYLFTNSSFVNNFRDGLSYSVIDMCGNEGKGEVVQAQKNSRLLDTGSEKITLVKHRNGTDYWLITTKHFTNQYYAYHISSAGIAAPVISVSGPLHDGGYWGAIGQMKAAPDGKHIAWVDGNRYPSVAVLMDFDNSNGQVNNPVILAPFAGYFYGLSFSPGSNRLYLSVSTTAAEIDAFDITGNTAAAINASLQRIPLGCTGMQLGPDGRIYFSHYDVTSTPMIGVLSDPDRTYTASSFSTIALPGQTTFMAFPSFLDSYKYGNTSPDCSQPPADTVTEPPVVPARPCNVFLPNAFTPDRNGKNDEFRIVTQERLKSVLRIFNRWGEQVFFSYSQQKGWDGYYNGQPAPLGTYFYLLTYDCDWSDKTQVQKGSMTLLR